MVKLVFKSGPLIGSTIRLKPGLNRIGRNPGNDVQIAEPSISGFHCEMHVSPLGVVFRDVGSRNGSYIEGRRVEKEILSSGKTLKLGTIEVDLDVPQAKVAIPEQEKAPEIFANFLADGTQACQTHAEVAANFRCVKCEKTWCPECVKRTGLVGSANATYSCNECGGKCERIEVVAAKGKRSLLGKIGETIGRFRN
jgi:hypothetical protein